MLSDIGRTFLYQCSHRPSNSVYDPPWVGADHSEEIGLVLGWPFHDITEYIDITYNEQEAELSKVIMKYWANFARSG